MMPGCGIAATPISAVLGYEPAAAAHVALLRSAVGHRVFLIEAEAWDADAAVVRTLRTASEPYITGPGDDPPNTLYEARLVEPFNYGASVAFGIGVSARGVFNAGEVRFAVADPWWRERLDWTFAGYPVRVYVGGPGWQRRDFAQIASVRATGLDFGVATASLLLADGAGRLDKPFLTDTYAGTGGAEGGEDLKDRVRPWVHGEAYNVDPVAVDPARLIYEVGGSAHAVRDGGVPIAPGLAFPDYAALEAATVPPDLDPDIPASHYATCPGYFRLASMPAGEVRADVRAEGFAGHTTRTLLEEAAARAGGHVDASAMVELGQRVPGRIGIYLRDDRSIDAVIEAAVAGMGGVWWVTPLGLIAAAPQRLPGSSAALDLTEADLIDMERAGSLPPVERVRVGWRRNWSPLATVLEGVPEAERVPLRDPYRLVTVANDGIAGAYPDAADPPVIESLFVAETDATEVAARLAALFDRERRYWIARAKTAALNLAPMQCVRARAKGLDGYGTVAAVEIQAGAQTVDLTIFR